MRAEGDTVTRRIRSRAAAGLVALSVAGLVAGLLPTSATANGGAVAGSGSGVRFATFNASLNRAVDGGLVADLSTPGDQQASNVA
jgi:hypothetical protein